MGNTSLAYKHLLNSVRLPRHLSRVPSSVQLLLLLASHLRQMSSLNKKNLSLSLPRFTNKYGGFWQHWASSMYGSVWPFWQYCTQASRHTNQKIDQQSTLVFFPILTFKTMFFLIKNRTTTLTFHSQEKVGQLGKRKRALCWSIFLFVYASIGHMLLLDERTLCWPAGRSFSVWARALWSPPDRRRSSWGHGTRNDHSRPNKKWK